MLLSHFVPAYPPLPPCPQVHSLCILAASLKYSNMSPEINNKGDQKRYYTVKALGKVCITLPSAFTV